MANERLSTPEKRVTNPHSAVWRDHNLSSATRSAVKWVPVISETWDVWK